MGRKRKREGVEGSKDGKVGKPDSYASALKTQGLKLPAFRLMRARLWSATDRDAENGPQRGRRRRQDISGRQNLAPTETIHVD